MSEAQAPSAAPKKLPEGFQTYEDGKQRRYGLLFAVNGGAFAVASLLSAKDPPAVGLLQPWVLSLAMIVFTLAMGLDIYLFGSKMRDEYKMDVFRAPGVRLLLLICAIISVGWTLAGFHGLAASSPPAPQVGRFQMSGVPGHAYVIDTVTGQVWEDFASPTQGSSHPDFRLPKTTSKTSPAVQASKTGGP